MDLNDWIISGGGAQGDSFFHKNDPEVMLKLYSENIGKEYVQQEYEFGRQVSKAGIRSPEALEMVRVGNRYGIVFRRIADKKSFCRLAGERPELIGTLGRRLAEMAREIHSKPSAGLGFPRSYTIYRNLFESIDYLDDPMRARISKALEHIESEDRDTLVHGDFHFGNVITDGREDYFIDLGNLSYGNPKIDLAMFYIVTHYGSYELLYNIFHLDLQQGLDFWNAFKTEYFGKDIPDTEILPELKDYMLVRSLWMQLDTGRAPFSIQMMNLFASDDCPTEDRSIG